MMNKDLAISGSPEIIEQGGGSAEMSHEVYGGTKGDTWNGTRRPILRAPASLLSLTPEGFGG